MNRRRAMTWLVRGIGLGTVGAVAGPVIVSLLSPVLRARPTSDWRPIGQAGRFEPEQMHEAVIEGPGDMWPEAVEPRGVYVWRNPDGAFIVFSRACTDLGCPVTYDRGSGWFFCPCHGGIFNAEGEPVAGPPPRRLYRYQTRVRRGILEVDVRSVPPVA